MSSPIDRCSLRDDLASPDFWDPVIEFYKAKVDRAELRANLALTVEERFIKAERRHRQLDRIRRCEELLAQAASALEEARSLLSKMSV